MRSASERSFTDGSPRVCIPRVGIANVSTGLSGSKEILKNLTRSAVWMIFVKGCGASNHLLQHCLDPNHGPVQCQRINRWWQSPPSLWAARTCNSPTWSAAARTKTSVQQATRQLPVRWSAAARTKTSAQQATRQLPGRRLLSFLVGWQLPGRRLLRNRLLGSCQDVVRAARTKTSAQRATRQLSGRRLLSFLDLLVYEFISFFSFLDY